MIRNILNKSFELQSANATRITRGANSRKIVQKDLKNVQRREVILHIYTESPMAPFRGPILPNSFIFF